jgi:hypothetical protein
MIADESIAEIKPKKRDVQRVAKLEEIQALLALPLDQRPDIMPRFVEIRGKIYDVSKKYDQSFIQRNLEPKSMKADVKKRNPAPIIPIIEKFERIKKRSRLARKLNKKAK